MERPADLIAISTESLIGRRGKPLPEESAASDMQQQLQRPGHAGTHSRGGHIPPAPVKKVAITTQVEPELRLFYKIWAPQLGINMQDMQDVALRLARARLESVPERERLALWEVIKREAVSANEADA